MPGMPPALAGLEALVATAWGRSWDVCVGFERTSLFFRESLVLT